MELSDIEAARQRIKPFIKKTPLIRCFELETLTKTGQRIFLKCDNLQVTNSFKTRGAFNNLLNLPMQDKQRGVITRSAGNFAQALALAGQKLGISTTIIMPENVPVIKKELTAQYGPRIVLHGTTQQEETAKVAEIAAVEKLVVLSPYDNLDVIAGQGTMALEILEQLPSVQHFFGPIGGGGLMAGAAVAFKKTKPSVETIGVEPIGAQDYFLSRQAGKLTRLEKVDTIADGLRAPQVGEHNWPLLQEYVDTVLVVPDKAIISAMRILYEKAGIVTEPSGATSVAALLAHPHLKFKGDIVFVLSGANVDKDKFYSWLETEHMNTPIL